MASPHGPGVCASEKEFAVNTRVCLGLHESCGDMRRERRSKALFLRTLLPLAFCSFPESRRCLRFECAALALLYLYSSRFNCSLNISFLRARPLSLWLGNYATIGSMSSGLISVKNDRRIIF